MIVWFIRYQIIISQVLFRQGAVFERSYVLLAEGIGLQLLRRPYQLTDIVYRLQGIAPRTFASFLRADHLSGVGDVDAGIFIEPRPAQYFLIEEEEPVEF